MKIGLSTDKSSFSALDADGNYAGFDVDLGKAITAALFDDVSKLEIKTQTFNDSFANTANGVVDISAMGITENLMRDATLGIDFSPTYLYTGQGVLVRKSSGISTLPALNGYRIGVRSGATSLQNLQDAISKFRGNFTPIEFATNDELFAAYERGSIDAVSTDIAILTARVPTLSNPNEHRVLDDILSKEPLSLVIDENQSKWTDVVRWTIYALIQAEEFGITSENIDALIALNLDTDSSNHSTIDVRQFLGLEGDIGKGLGLSNDFVVNIIKSVGNYSEIYERHFNSDVLRRDLNELTDSSGLQFAPPIGSSSVYENIETITPNVSKSLFFKFDEVNIPGTSELVIFSLESDGSKQQLSNIFLIPDGQLNGEFVQKESISAQLLTGDIALQFELNTGDVLRTGALTISNSGLIDVDFGDNIQVSLVPTEQASVNLLNAGADSIDLSQFAGEDISINFFVYREANFNNTVGLYRDVDIDGSVRDVVTGDIIKPGESDYKAAALANRIDISLGSQNGRVQRFNTQLAGGGFAGLFLIVDGTNAETGEVYFGHAGMNSDNQDHAKFLGNNTVGFEDLAGLGDRDFNDIVVQFETTVV